MSPELMRVKEVADKLSLSKASVYRMVHSGRLDGVKLGGSIRIYPASVEEYLKASRVVEMGDFGGMAPAHEQPSLFESAEGE